VDYFYTAATPRSRGALWTIFAPAFSLFRVEANAETGRLILAQLRPCMRLQL
jgi:hypothetical protein